MRRIAVINHQSCSGKTTITTNLGHALALQGYRVMVIDLDPKGDLSSRYGLFKKPQNGIDQLLLGNVGYEKVTISIRDMVALIPAAQRLGEVEAITEGGVKRAKLLNDLLEGEMLEQDFILIDCPDNFGMLMTNAIFAADEALIPTGADRESLEELCNILKTLNKLKPFIKRPLEKSIVMSRIFPRKHPAKRAMNLLINNFSRELIPVEIGESLVLSESSAAGRTIYEYRSSSKYVQQFSRLARELIIKHQEIGSHS